MMACPTTHRQAKATDRLLRSIFKSLAGSGATRAAFAASQRLEVAQLDALWLQLPGAAVAVCPPLVHGGQTVLVDHTLFCSNQPFPWPPHCFLQTSSR